MLERAPLRPDVRAIRAVVFDVDGTLYRQDKLRKRMLVRLLTAHLTHPVRGWRTGRILQAYRRAQEDLRASGVTENVARAQIRRTSELTRAESVTVIECTTRWMEHEPLALLAGCIQPGLAEFLGACKARGMLLGTLSDYPAADKVEALGVASFFDVVLCAQDPAVDCFKPNPRGLLVALERLRAEPSESLYIGDRLDVDAPTAEGAGVGCAILTKRQPARISPGVTCVAGYAELQKVLFPD